MAALYAFCRAVDDIADEDLRSPRTRREQLEAWRNDVRSACQGGAPQFAVNRELQPFITTYGLRYELFDEVIRGCEMDLDRVRYADYPALEQYCFRVASAVGLLSIEVFGYTDPACREYAIALGKALQFTNILRDVGVDARRGRIYLPRAELDRFGVTEEAILHGESSAEYQALAADFARRARAFFRQARETLPAADRRSMVAAELMAAVYWRLLDKLERHAFNVFSPRLTRLSKPYKLLLILKAWWRLTTGAGAPVYG